MVKLGDDNHLRVSKQVDFGLYLDGGAYGEILLPKRYVPAGTEVDSSLDVFIYLDSEDRLVATTERPKVKVGECAALKVVDSSRPGAFLDWGLPKDLLVPRNEQSTLIEVGQTHVVYVYIDVGTESIVASARLERHLSELGYYFQAGQAVDVLIYARSDLGYKAVINHSHLGLLYASEVFQTLSIGDNLKAYIKQIRPDRRIDLSLQVPGKVVEEDLPEKILSYLRAQGGTSDLTDKASPERIYAEFQVSKAHFKRALGLLYKQKRIHLSKERLTLADFESN